jgi:hypothetical protein
MLALKVGMRRRYVQDTASMLRKDFPDKFRMTASDDVERFVLEAIADADAHGVTLRSDLTFYIRLQAVLSPLLADPSHSWARDILRRDDLSGTEKMDRIHDHLVFSQACGG